MEEQIKALIEKYEAIKVEDEGFQSYCKSQGMHELVNQYEGKILLLNSIIYDLKQLINK